MEFLCAPGILVQKVSVKFYSISQMCGCMLPSVCSAAGSQECTVSFVYQNAVVFCASEELLRLLLYYYLISKQFLVICFGSLRESRSQFDIGKQDTFSLPPTTVPSLSALQSVRRTKLVLLVISVVLTTIIVTRYHHIPTYYIRSQNANSSQSLRWAFY